MSFVRCFDRAFPKKDHALYRLIYDDIKAGIVFPALRVNELDFYHGGGVLFEYNGTSFKRNPAYDPEINAKLKADGKSITPISDSTYMNRYGVNFIDSYRAFKINNVNRFNNNGKPNERQFLEMLHEHTYRGIDFPEICVLDIEVRFNEGGSQKKCDLTLFNKKTCEIMFVEGKIFSDPRVSSGTKDNVILQVNEYNRLINGNIQTIEAQYANHIAIMSQLIFEYELKVEPCVLPKVALLVYETPTDEEIESKFEYRARRSIKHKVAENGIPSLWIGKGEHEHYSLANIWNTLVDGF